MKENFLKAKEKIRIKPKLKFIDRKRKQQQGYKIEIRKGERKGDRFIETKDPPLPRKIATLKMMNIIDNTTAASGRIVPKGKTKLKDINKIPDGISMKFRQRKGKTKLPKKTFVERRKFRIDSPGEKLGIPFSPIRIIRQKQSLQRKRPKKRTVTKKIKRVGKFL